MWRCFTIWAFLLFSFTCAAQTRIIDSLKKKVQAAHNDKSRLEAMLALCDEFKSLHRDTLEYYSKLARQLAADMGDHRQKTLAELAMANCYFRWGWKDSAMAVIDPVLAANPVNKEATRSLHFKIARQKALYFGGGSQFTQALGVLYQLVSDAEKYKDTLIIGANMNTIGSVALLRSAPRTALSWFVKALAYNTHDARYTPVMAAIYVNMADAYNALGKSDSADYYIEKGTRLFRQVQNLTDLAHALQRQSAIYIKEKKFDKAEAALKDMIDVRRQTNDGAMWVDDNLALIDFYIETKQIDKAIEYCNSFLISGNLEEVKGSEGRVYSNNSNIRLDYYEALARCYKVAGNSEKYQETLERIIAAKDTFYLTNSAEAVAEVQTKYEVQKKENTIIQQKLDLTRKNNLFYLTLGAIAFVAVVAIILFIGYNKREKLKMQLMLEKQKDMAVKAVANAEENERKRIAADLHDSLGAYAASIASNLDFIRVEKRDDQGTIALKELENNSKAMVSQLGDTIWALNKESLSLTAISDRLKILVKRIQPSYPQFEFEVLEKIQQDISLPPTQAFHLFRIVQEAVVNAVRHSGGNKVTVLLESDDQWRISITDNGNGIPIEKPNLTGGGNGLLNMKRRADVSGWEISWSSALPAGTSVIIRPTAN